MGLQELPSLTPAALGITLLSVIVLSALSSICAWVLLLRLPLPNSSKRNPGREIPFRQIATVAQVAAASLILGTFGTALQVAEKLSSQNLGFNPRSTWLVEADFTKLADQPLQLISYQRSVRQELQKGRNIERVAFAAGLPALGAPGSFTFTVEVPGYEPVALEELAAQYAFVDSGFFRTLSIPITEGTTFSESSNPETETADVVVSSEMAKKYWPSTSPIGAKLLLADNKEATVVGVSGDVRYSGPQSDVGPILFLPLDQPKTFMLTPRILPIATAFVKVIGGGESLFALANSTMRRLDDRVTPYEVRRVEEILADSYQRERSTALALGVLALCLAGIAILGLHNAILQFIEHSRRSIAVRLSLGARPARLAWSVFRKVAPLVLIGWFLALSVFGYALSRFNVLELDFLPKSIVSSILTLFLLLLGVALLSWSGVRRTYNKDRHLDVLRES